MNNYKLLEHLNQILQPEQFKDYCPNGLQIEGSANITKIITGVSLNDALINAAIKHGANAIIVHHGIFWYKDDYTISGIKRLRITKLLEHGINLYAYHLPLDNHPTIGNNIQLSKLLDIQVRGQTDRQNLLWYGSLANELSIEQFSSLIASRLNHKPLCLYASTNKKISTIAWCTGGADGLFNAAINLGVDAYLTGEAAEPSQAMALESDVAFIAAGHYATERYGVMALGNHLNERFGFDVQFTELYNPV